MVCEHWSGILDYELEEVNRKMATARVIKSGNGQVVLLPKEFPIKTKRVEIFRDGQEIVIKERPDLPKRQK